MRQLELEPGPLPPGVEWYGIPKPDARLEVISTPVRISTPAGEPLLWFGPYDGGHELEIVEALAPVRSHSQGVTGKRGRTDGLRANFTRTFGYMPRNEVRANYCRPCTVAFEYPRLELLLRGLASSVATMMARELPELYARQAHIVDVVQPEWRVNEVFTSGIVNLNNALAYHKDAGNFPECWSGMVVIPMDFEGGLLNIPELGIAIDFAAMPSSLIFFNGQRLLHGVTPIRCVSRVGHRVSIVCYALQKMRNCLPAAAELERAQAVRTAAERRTKDGRTIAKPRRKRVIA